MANSYLWFEHTDPAVQNAFASASSYVQKNPPTYKAYQAQQNIALHVAPQGATYQVPQNYWLVINASNEISVYSNADFVALYEAA